MNSSSRGPNAASPKAMRPRGSPGSESHQAQRSQLGKTGNGCRGLPLRSHSRDPHSDDRDADDARAVLQPLVAGERSPLLVERRERVTPQRPSWVNRSHRMWLTTPIASEATRSSMPRHDARQRCRRPGRRRVIASVSRARRAAPRSQSRGKARREPARRRARARRVAGGTATPAAARARAASWREATRSRGCVRSRAASPRRNSGRSGVIAPTAIAAGTSGVPTNGSATTAWLGVNGTRQPAWPTKRPARVFLPRRSTDTPPGREPVTDRRVVLDLDAVERDAALRDRPPSFAEARDEPGVDERLHDRRARRRRRRAAAPRSAAAASRRRAPSGRPGRRAPRMPRSPRPRHPPRARAW